MTGASDAVLERDRSEAVFARVDRATVTLIGVAAVLFALNVDFTLYGDAALYADYVVRRQFDELTLHLGYYALVALADAIMRPLFGIPIEQSMVWLDVVAGALTIGVAYRLARELLATEGEAIACTVAFMLSGRVLTNATTSEIYMLQTLFVLGACLAWLRARPALAGVLAAGSLLVSPLSAFAFLFFPVAAWLRPGPMPWGALMRMAIAGTVVYLPYLVVHGHELFFGVRGLLVIREQSPVDVATAAFNVPKYQFEAYSAMLLVLVPALVALRTRRNLLALSLAVAVPHIYIILKLTGEDNVFLLNTDFFFCCWLAVGWTELRRRLARPVPAAMPLAIHAAVYVVAGALFAFESNRGQADEIRSVVSRTIAAPDAVLVTDWGSAQAVAFLGRERPTTALRREPLYGRIFDVQNIDEMLPGALDVGQIYLYDTWRAGPMSRLLRTAESRRRQEATFSVRGQAARELGLACTLLESGHGRLYRCARGTRTG